MNTTTTRSQSQDSSGVTRKMRLGRLLATGALICAIIACISNLSKSESPATVESVFAEGNRSRPGGHCFVN
jgi:hypothetical protein